MQTPHQPLTPPAREAQDAQATSDASSLEVKGSVHDETGTIEPDMALGTKGQCAGTMGTGGEGSLDLITC